MEPRFGLSPRAAADGSLGYTITEAARLLAVNDQTIRNRHGEALVTTDDGLTLCPATLIEDERAKALVDLGAVEPGAQDDTNSAHLATIAALEHRLRLLLAARAGQRDKVRGELATEEALDEMLLQNLSIGSLGVADDDTTSH